MLPSCANACESTTLVSVSPSKLSNNAASPSAAPTAGTCPHDPHRPLPSCSHPVPFRCSTVPLQPRTRNGTTTATLRVIYPATNLGPGRATQQVSSASDIADSFQPDLVGRLAVLPDCIFAFPVGEPFQVRLGQIVLTPVFRHGLMSLEYILYSLTRCPQPHEALRVLSAPHRRRDGRQSASMSVCYRHSRGLFPTLPREAAYVARSPCSGPLPTGIPRRLLLSSSDMIAATRI